MNNFAYPASIAVVGICSTIAAGSPPTITFDFDLLRSPGQLYDVNRYDYLASQINAGHYGYSEILRIISNASGSIGQLQLVADDYASGQSVVVSYSDLDGNWHSYTDNVIGNFQQWSMSIAQNAHFDFQHMFFTVEAEPSIASTSRTVPGIPAPSGIALLALGGIACSRRRR